MTAEPQPGHPVDPTKNVLDKVEDLAKLFEAKLGGHRELMDAKLDAIAHEFELVEGRRVEQKVDTKTAVDAALSAAKDAVKEQAANFTAQLQAVESILSDLKDRVIKMESSKLGGQEVRATQRLDINMIVLIVAVLIAAATFVIGRGAGA